MAECMCCGQSVPHGSVHIVDLNTRPIPKEQSPTKASRMPRRPPQGEGVSITVRGMGIELEHTEIIPLSATLGEFKMLVEEHMGSRPYMLLNDQYQPMGQDSMTLLEAGISGDALLYDSEDFGGAC